MSAIYEDDSQDLILPFDFSVEDQFTQKHWSLKYLQDISMVSTFEDIDKMGVDFDEEKDFIK